MTKLLEEAFARAADLPTKEQEALGALILEEIDADAKWTQALDSSQREIADRAAQELGVRSFRIDVRQPAECQRLVEEVTTELGSLDILVNTAGQSSFGSVLDMTDAAWRLEIETNLTGSFLMAQAAARAMVAQGRAGRIILFGSTAAESARAGGVSHCASKAGVLMLAKVMALELGQHGITVNAISPWPRASPWPGVQQYVP